jgi:hypothetical protein
VRRLLVIGCLLLCAAGCSEPPQKELDQAQTALDSARTAGAERYATSEFTAATSSLDKARAAVDQRDYRQALNYAIDSRQRSTEAARVAAEGKARAKRDVEALYNATATRANELQAAIRTAESGGATAKALKPSQAVLADVRAGLQEASAAMSGGNFEDATKRLTEVRGKLDPAITQAQNIPRSPARRRGR